MHKQQAQQPMFQKPVMPQPTQKPAMQPQAQASKPHLSPSTGIASIKEYVNKQSNNPKVRIRYFLESGYMLLENKDQKNAQEIYKFIFEEYRNLEFHDEDLYRTIVSFRLGIR